jgi:hypothetical protein
LKGGRFHARRPLFNKEDFVMANFKRPHLLAALFLVLYVAACSEGGTDKPSTPDPTPPVEDGKTYLKVTNNTSYAVNVYINDPPLYGKAADTLKTVSRSGSNQWELQPSAEGSNGETLYFEYLIPVGNDEVIIPFYTNTTDSIKLAILKKGETTTVTVPDLPSVTTDSSYLVVRNNTEDALWLQQGIGTVYPFGATVREIAADSAAVYILNGVSSLSGYTIGATTRRDFPNTPLQKGLFYVFSYDSKSGVQLDNLGHFDPSMAGKTWTLPTSAELGKYFTVGLLQARENVETDGYILVGRVNYNADMAKQDRAGSTPYLAAISPSGDVVERKIILRSNPSTLKPRSFIDEGTELVFTGQAYYESTDGTPFILGTDYTGEPLFYLDNDFLADIDIDEQSKAGQRIAKDQRGDYAIGGNIYDFDTNTNRTYLDKVTRKTFDEAEYEPLWRQPRDDGNSKLLFLSYDPDADAYIVVTDDFGTDDSLLYIVNAVDGSQKSKIRLEQYTINQIFKIGDDYYAAGTYYGVSKYRGFIRKLNIGGGAWDGNPLFVDSKYPDGASMIYSVVQDKDGSLVFGGACVEDAGHQDDREASMSWLIKYDLNAKTKVWERVYNDYLGSYIYSMQRSSSGGYVLELFNNATSQSTLVGTDLLGAIGGDEKAAIPRGAQFTVSQPGSPGISAVVVPLEDAEMQETEPLILPKGQSAVIQVKGQWASYRWYVNGSPVATTATYSFASAAREPGVYTVMVVVTNADGAKRSAWRRVRVTN